MIMLGENIQGSDLKTIHANIWRLVRKIVLALILAKATLQAVTGEESRISMGQVPPPGKYPAIGRLLAPSSTINSSLCILSILNRDWLLTTGKCGLSKGDFIVVGDEIVNETEPFEQVVKVERVIVHHRHDNFKASFNKQEGDDIAVFKVTPPIKFSNRVTATNLPTCKELESGITGMVVGYGSEERANAPIGRQQNHRLMEITNKIISHEECRKFYKDRPLDDRVFCVEAINNMSTCLGDSGAPFYQVKSDAHMVLQGFMSVAPIRGRCGIVDKVAIFTRVSSYVGWIHRRISGCGNHPWSNGSNYRLGAVAEDDEMPTSE